MPKPKKKNILVVDNSKGILESFEALIGDEENLEIVYAENGFAALANLKEARAWSPDLIFLDICMPGMDGIEVLREMFKRKKEFNTPVVIISASADDSRIKEAEELGVHSYLKKPINPGDIMKVARECLAG